MRLLIAALAAALLTPSSAATDWTWPLDDPAPQVVQSFAPPDHPWSAGHRGVDLAGEPGDVVLAAGSGTVSYAGLIAGVGVVTVSHGVVRTTYQPVAPRVSVGERVGVGQPIGTLTIGGSHCRPRACLHWGLIRGSEYLDPLSLMPTAGPPRLLPLGDVALTRAAQGHPVVAAESTSARAAVGAMAGIPSERHDRGM